MVSIACASAVAGARRGDVDVLGWTVDAAWAVTGLWLIAIAVLHIALFEWLYRDAKREERDKVWEEERMADRKRIKKLEDIIRRNGLE